MITDAAKYSPLQVGARTVRTFLMRNAPTSGNGQYPLDGSSVVTYQIPCQRNCIYLWNDARMNCRGNYSLTSAAGNISAYVDGSVYSAFKRTNVSIDGVGLIESINEVGKLMILWKQCTVDATQEAGFDSILEGSNNDAVTWGTGISLLPATNTSGSTFTPKQSYSCLLPCGLAMCDKAFPAFAMAGKSIEINITMATANEHLYATSGTTITAASTTANYFDQFELIIPVIQYSDDAIAVIRAAAGPDLFYSYRSFDTNMWLTASGTNPITLNSNKRSVLALLGGFWYTTKTNSSTRLTGLRSIAGGLTEAWLDIDGQAYPQNHLTSALTTSSATTGIVRNNSQFAAELLCVVNQFSNSLRPSALDTDLWYPVSGTADDANLFAFGINLETQPSVYLPSSSVWTGRDFSNTNATLNLTVGAARQMVAYYIHMRTLRVAADGSISLLY